jgi:hypothetical protein
VEKLLLSIFGSLPLKGGSFGRVVCVLLAFLHTRQSAFIELSRCCSRNADHPKIFRQIGERQVHQIYQGKKCAALVFIHKTRREIKKLGSDDMRSFEKCKKDQLDKENLHGPIEHMKCKMQRKNSLAR